MNDKQQAIYKIFAYTFIGIGFVFIALDLSEEIFAFSVIKGNPFPVALLVTLLGFALLWTVRKSR